MLITAMNQIEASSVGKVEAGAVGDLEQAFVGRIRVGPERTGSVVSSGTRYVGRSTDWGLCVHGAIVSHGSKYRQIIKL
jgi:hypothetical protein